MNHGGECTGCHATPGSAGRQDGAGRLAVGGTADGRSGPGTRTDTPRVELVGGWYDAWPWPCRRGGPLVHRPRRVFVRPGGRAIARWRSGHWQSPCCARQLRRHTHCARIPVPNRVCRRHRGADAAPSASPTALVDPVGDAGPAGRSAHRWPPRNRGRGRPTHRGRDDRRRPRGASAVRAGRGGHPRAGAGRGRHPALHGAVPDDACGGHRSDPEQPTLLRRLGRAMASPLRARGRRAKRPRSAATAGRAPRVERRRVLVGNLHAAHHDPGRAAQRLLEHGAARCPGDTPRCSLRPGPCLVVLRSRPAGAAPGLLDRW